MTYCKQCLEKQQKINYLQEEIVQLKAKLRYQQRTANEGFFGSSTPSSRIPIKPNNPAEHTNNRGGGKTGHKGYGRSSIQKQDADEVKTVKVENTCPDCGGILEDKGSRTRTVMDCQPIKIKKLLYHLERKYCPRCQKVVAAKAPGVLPRCLYSNNLLTLVAVQHYIYGNTLVLQRYFSSSFLGG